MWTLTQLAARNLWRNARRTVITLMALVFGLVFVHVAVVMQTGQYEEMIRVGVGSLAGHVVVQADGYQDNKDTDLVLEGADRVRDTLTAQFPEATVAPRMFLGGLLTSTTGSVGAGLSGIDPGAEAKVQDLPEKIIEGDWLDDDRGVVIGAKMAESLSVTVGDKVVWMGQYGDNPDMVSRLFRVKGVFQTGAAELDGFLALAHIDATRALFGGGDVAHQVTLHIADPGRSRAATDQAQLALAAAPGLEVLSWSEALPSIYGLIQLDRKSGDAMLIIILIIVTMGVLNTVLMSALERTREFGVMLALGMKPRRLAGVILMEGLLLGIIGSLLGLAAGVAVSTPIVAYGIDYSGMMGAETIESGGIAISALMKGAWNPWRMGIYTVGAMMFTTLAAVYPAIHVARLMPVDAMRHV